VGQQPRHFSLNDVETAVVVGSCFRLIGNLNCRDDMLYEAVQPLRSRQYALKETSGPRSSPHLQQKPFPKQPSSPPPQHVELHVTPSSGRTDGIKLQYR
jgi:hypothetical protein